MRHDESWETVDVGRKSRTTPTPLRRVLHARDGGCRFPGCGLRHCESHHIVHWADGGPTDQRNTVLLCRYHHRLVHEGGFGVHFPEFPEHGRVNFYDRRGRPVPDVPPPLDPGPDPVGRMIEGNRARGADPDGLACSARYARADDLPPELQWRALEAAAPGG